MLENTTDLKNVFYRYFVPLCIDKTSRDRLSIAYNALVGKHISGNCCFYPEILYCQCSAHSGPPGLEESKIRVQMMENLTKIDLATGSDGFWECSRVLQMIF